MNPLVYYIFEKNHWNDKLYIAKRLFHSFAWVRHDNILNDSLQCIILCKNVLHYDHNSNAFSLPFFKAFVIKSICPWVANSRFWSYFSKVKTDLIMQIWFKLAFSTFFHQCFLISMKMQILCKINLQIRVIWQVDSGANCA